MYFLQTKNIFKQYDGHLALNDVSIGIPHGKIVGLLGPNGAGKTTLIRIINRITAPDSGTVLFKNRPYTEKDIYNIGYLPEERGLYKKMKVGEQAIYLSRLKGLSSQEAEKRIQVWFEKFGILSWWDKKLEELSKGMQQKIQFITTVIHEPQLLIFDEPFSGFDPVNTQLLKNEILELKERGKTIIFSTHNMSSVEEICDEIALFNKSRVVLTGEVKEIRSRYRTETYNLKIKYPVPSEDNNMYRIIAQTENKDHVSLQVKKLAGISNSVLLSEIGKGNEILSFEEETPSMNDIFIKLVSDK